MKKRWERLGFKSPQHFAGKCSAVKRKIAKLNPRRFELIEQECMGDGLNKAEEKELKRLQKQVGDLVDIIAPTPDVPARLTRLASRLEANE